MLTQGRLHLLCRGHHRDGVNDQPARIVSLGSVQRAASAVPLRGTTGLAGVVWLLSICTASAFSRENV
jgi:hypothetical protein